MSHIGKNFGIVCERTLKRVSIIDTDTLAVLHQIILPNNTNNVPADPIDVVITPDRSKALISSYNSKTLYTIDLTQDPPTVNSGVIFSADVLGDIDITPDGHFTVTVGGAPSGNDFIESFDVQSQSFVTQIKQKNDAVTISQDGLGKVYATTFANNNLNFLNLNTATGVLTNSVSVASGGLEPLNVTLSYDCKFAFVLNSKAAGSNRNIAIFDITSTTPILLNTIRLDDAPQSAVISCSENKLYVLTATTLGKNNGGGNIKIFNVSSTSPYLTLSSTISLGSLPVNGYAGIDQIALSQSGNYIFASSSLNSTTSGVLAVFKTDGTSLGTINGISANGGVFTQNCSYIDPTPVPTTPRPTTPAPTTPAPTTPAPTTPAPTTPAPTTPAPTTPAPTTPKPTTPKPTTPAPTTPAPTTPAPTTPKPTTPAPTTPAPTTPAPTTPAPTTPAPTTPAPTSAPCACCFVDEKPVVYAKCQLTQTESFNNITLNCTGRFLDVDVTLINVCPNKFANVGVLVYEGTRLLSSKICRLFTDGGTGCIPILNAGRFCFVFDDDSCPAARTLTVRIVTNYVES